MADSGPIGRPDVLFLDPPCLYAYTAMCGAIRFVVEGQARTVSAGIADALLPVLMRTGRVKWVEWGAPAEQHISSPEAPGYVLKLLEGYWVELATLRAGALWQYKPRAVKIAASAFGVYMPAGNVTLERWIRLKRGQCIQGALATVFAERRVYVVTVPPPPEYSAAQPCWPRIV